MANILIEQNSDTTWSVTMFTEGGPVKKFNAPNRDHAIGMAEILKLECSGSIVINENKNGSSFVASRTWLICDKCGGKEHISTAHLHTCDYHGNYLS